MMPKGYLLLVLHAHLPYVHHPEYDRFLEERWLFEAITETHVPLIKFFDRLKAEGTSFKITLSVSPTLSAMLEDESLAKRYVRHIELCLRLTEREIARTHHQADENRLARMYRTLFEEARHVFVERSGRRILGPFREHAEAGLVELITCAGTHGFLPGLASNPSMVRAHILSATTEHERLFGRKPAGMWLPECGFYPGLDEVLREAGVRYTFVENHGIEHATPRPLFGVNAPLYCPSGVAVFGRHPTTSKLVWSGMVGYPADPHYREYHRDIGFDLEQSYLEPFQYAPGVRTSTGIKYHRITGPGPHKQLYDPDRGRETAERHARDFVTRCRDQAARASQTMPFPALIVSPYDAELFGHWWFEGPQWLYYVLREMATDKDLALCTPSQYLDAHPVQQKAVPAPSTWGTNGYSEHWINAKTDWLWRPLHEASWRLTAAAAANAAHAPDSTEARVLRQAARELMLAQSSDWPFIITNGTTAQYARRRFLDHLGRFHDLLDDFEGGAVDVDKLATLEQMDAIFPELDYRLFAPPRACA